MSDSRIVVLGGARTPVGSFGGVFKDVPAHELGAIAARAAFARTDVSPEELDEVVMGCIGQVGPDAYNARRVALSAGVPTRVPAFTVNRLCGSGLQAVWSAAQEIRWGSASMVLAGGDENMTRMPFYDFGARSGYKLGDRTLTDGTVMMLTDPFHNIHMGVTAERVAEKYGVTRQEQDEFAAESQRRAATDAAKAAFAPDQPGVALGAISRFGVLEIAIPWRTEPLIERLADPDGQLSVATEALALIRAIEREAGPGRRVRATCSPDVAEAANALAPRLIERIGARFDIVAEANRPRAGWTAQSL